MPRATEKSEKKCSLCGSSHHESEYLFAAASGYICDNCVDTFHRVLVSTREEKVAPIRNTRRPKTIPSDIFGFLQQYIIGQDRAKKVLSVAVYNHLKRIDAWDNPVELQKSNILLVGPSGTGKTLFAQTLAKLLNVPFAIADATALTEAGYVGEDVESLLSRLLQAADQGGSIENTISRAECGIIYVDEIDKIGRKSDNPSITRDVSGEGVQQALLKIIEGTVAYVAPQGGRKHPHQDFIRLDTSQILFICGGSFEGLEKQVSKKTISDSLGLRNGPATKDSKAAALQQRMSRLTPDDLVEYGMIPELVGRLPVIVTLEEADVDTLVRILVEPKNALVKQYQTLFVMDRVDLVFEPEALLEIAKKAKTLKTGARALRVILEELMTDVMYDLPSKPDIVKCIITKECVSNGAEPTLIAKREIRQAS